MKKEILKSLGFPFLIIVITLLGVFAFKHYYINSSNESIQIHSDEELKTLANKTLIEFQKGNTLFVAKVFRAISVYYVQEIEQIDYEKFRKNTRKNYPNFNDEIIELLAKSAVAHFTRFRLKEAASASYYAGTLFEDLCRWEEALSCYKKSVELDPEDDKYQKALRSLNDKRYDS